MADTLQFEEEQTGSEGPDDGKALNTFEGKDTNATDDTDKSGEGGSDDRPDWLPEKFKTVDDFVKSAETAQSELTKAQQELAELKKGNGKETDGEADGGEEDEDSSDAPDFSSLTAEDFQDFSSEIAENGELSDESREKVKEMFPAPDWMIDNYIAGVKAQNEAAGTAIDNAFGGAEARDAMLEWAGSNMKEAEIDMLEKQLNSEDMNTTLFAIDALRTKYEASEGKAPSGKLEGNGGPNGPTTDAYQSWAQVQADMSDLKYKTDKAFRNKVKAKMAASNSL